MIVVPSLIQVLLGYVVQPRIMGKSLNLNPVAILLALVLFGQMWGIPGMFLATPDLPPLQPLLLGTLGIGLAASAAGAINQILDRRFDELMARTRDRPMPTGHLSQRQAVAYAMLLAVGSMLVLVRKSANLTAAEAAARRSLLATHLAV